MLLLREARDKLVLLKEFLTDLLDEDQMKPIQDLKWILDSDLTIWAVGRMLDERTDVEIESLQAFVNHQVKKRGL